MQVVWTASAVRGVWRAYEYLYQFNPRAAMQLAGSLFTAGDGLMNFPHRGRLVPKTGMRELVTSHPYIIRYRIDGDTVVILRVRHTSRRPNKSINRHHRQSPRQRRQRIVWGVGNNRRGTSTNRIVLATRQ